MVLSDNSVMPMLVQVWGTFFIPSCSLRIPASVCIDPQPCFCKEPGYRGTRHHCISMSRPGTGWGFRHLLRWKGQEETQGEKLKPSDFFSQKQWRTSSRTVDVGRLMPTCLEVTLQGCGVLKGMNEQCSRERLDELSLRVTRNMTLSVGSSLHPHPVHVQLDRSSAGSPAAFPWPPSNTEI